MNLHRHALLLPALFLGAPLVAAGLAHAGDGRASFHATRARHHVSRSAHHAAAVVISGDWNTEASTVTARVASDAGDEEVPLTESDAWLHGSAALGTLPKKGATYSVYLYSDATGYVVGTVTGKLAADGTISVDDEKSETGDACSARSGCEATSDGAEESDATAVDIEVLAAELYPTSAGYTLALSLRGADTYDVAYGDLVLAPLDGTPGSTTEIAWDDVGSVWEADLDLEHEGVVDVRAVIRDAAGEKVEAPRGRLGLPWIDPGEGTNAIAIDDDPLTAVAVHAGGGGSPTAEGRGPATDLYFTVVSEGWDAAAELPVQAQITLADGAVTRLAVDSYHRRAAKKNTDSFFCSREFSYNGFVPLQLKSGAAVFENLDFDDLGSPICAEGVCVLLTENGDDTCDLSVSAYAATTAALPDGVEVWVTSLDEKGQARGADAAWFELDDDVVAVFTAAMTPSGNPVGADLDGAVKLLGAADKHGKQKTLAKGEFYGTLSRGSDGAFGIAAADKHRPTYRGDLVVKLTSPSGKEYTVQNRGVPTATPVRLGDGRARIGRVSAM